MPGRRPSEVFSRWEALDVTESAIFHITEPSRWEQGQADGSYTGSTRDADLSDVGYIHCSFRHQVEMVANFLYDDWQGDLVVLEIDTTQVPAEIRRRGKVPAHLRSSAGCSRDNRSPSAEAGKPLATADVPNCVGQPEHRKRESAIRTTQFGKPTAG